MTGEREERARECLAKAYERNHLQGVADWLRTSPLVMNTNYGVAIEAIMLAFSAQERDAAGEGCFSASYDQVSDVLYLAPNGPKPATCVDASISCLIRRSSETREFVGMTVIDWRAQCEAALATPSTDNAVLVERLEAIDWRKVVTDASWEQRFATSRDRDSAIISAIKQALAALRAPSTGEG